MSGLYRLALLVTACALLPPAAAWEDSDFAVEQWSTLSDAYVTPHTPWARPYAGGPLRILYFVASPQQGVTTRAREVVELRQRLEAEIDVVYEINFYGPKWFGGLAGMRRLSRLLDRPYDLYVFQDCTPSKLPNWPDAPATRFVEAVRRGAGVVVIGNEANPPKEALPDPLAEQVAIDARPSWLKSVPVVSLATFGKGRVLTLEPRPFIPYHLGWEAQYDQWQERLIRGLLWAAARPPPVLLAAEIPAEIAQHQLPRETAVSWLHAGKQVSCRARVRGAADGQVTELGLVGADGSGTVTVPRLRAGAYWLELTARSKTAAYGWQVEPFTVTAASAVEGLGIRGARALPFAHVERQTPQLQQDMDEQLGVFQPYYDDGDEIAGTVVTSGPAPAVTVRLCDVRQRILAQQSGPDYSFAVDSWMPMLMYLEAVIHDGAEELVARCEYVRHRQRRRGRFNFILWGFPGHETLAPYAAERLREMGVDVVYERGAAMSAAAAGLTWLPYTGGRVDRSQADRWRDPKSANYWVNHVGRAASHGALAYSLGDEGHTSGYGKDAVTLAAFSDFLARGYDDIAALNRAWRADFRSFDEAPLHGDLPADDAAWPAFSAAFDRFDFAGCNFVQMAKIHAAAIRQSRDADAVVGFEGAGRFDTETDPELICRELGFWAPYSGHVDELIRSIAPRQFIRSNWMGYHQTAAGHLSRYYYSLTNGCDSIWYWMWSTVGAWQGFQHPDLSGGVPALNEFIADTKFVRDGLGDLLLRYDLQHDGIAMLYSRASMFAAKQAICKPYGDYKQTHLTWHTMLQDLGVQYAYVTDRMIQRGEFDAAAFRVLILPLAHAMSATTARAVRDFVSGGGMVIADFRPAVFDGHVAPVDAVGSGQLDDLFGVQANGPPATAQGTSLTLAGAVAGRALTPFEFAGAPLAGAALAAGGGTALAEVAGRPVFIVNSHGAGRTVLLNLALPSITATRGETPNLSGQASAEETPQASGLLLLELLQAAGVQRRYVLTPYKNRGERKFVANLELQRWRNGDYELISLFRQTGIREMSGAWVQVAFNYSFGDGGARYVYDLRHGITVGKEFEGWSWIDDVVPARASFYVVMPQPCPAPQLMLAAATERGTVLRGTISVPGAGGLHALRLTVLTPDGAAAVPARTVITGATPISVTVPIAFNDPTGTWQVVVSDSFTPETRLQQALEVR